jgi:hypothetical protein
LTFGRASQSDKSSRQLVLFDGHIRELAAITKLGAARATSGLFALKTKHTGIIHERHPF